MVEWCKKMFNKELLSMAAQRIPASGTLKMNALSKELEEKGKIVIHLEVGQPNFKTPKPIAEAAYAAMLDGKTGYTSSKGIKELRDKIATIHSVDTGITINSKENVIITPGAKASLFEALISLLNPSDNLIVVTPFWPSYEGIASFIGAKTKMVHTERNDFIFPIEDIKEAIDNNSKALIINSPSNPAGVVYDLDTLRAIKDLSEDHGLFVISDEIYKKIVFDVEYHQYLSVSQSLDRTLVVDGFSKSHAMTGWRIGYAIGDKALIESMNKIQQNSTTCVNAPTQWAALKAMDVIEPVNEMVNEYKERRDKALELIAECEHLSCKKPNGAFYLFIKYIGDIESYNLAVKLLDEKGVCLTPGSVFGVTENFVRISLASRLDLILEGIKRLNSFLSNYQ
ncbi:MAG: aminotransferase class I/II-fold pyridoxal phosphate-dependent enzyme [Candidatus Heimdallarchaeota archaeon]|nr:aminotransferase class I/II-fold pyridoxal phosphate-dependent enzyme [Candidatus Heimdallarchaeota archaeon]